MWVLGQTGALGIKPLRNGHGDVTAVSTGPPPVMDLGIKRPGLLGGPVEHVQTHSLGDSSRIDTTQQVEGRAMGGPPDPLGAR